GQAIGMPLSFGGPFLGLFACKESHVRRLPGRLVGETRDSSNKKAYVTTLRSREQDIRREKASSNVCTNQTLMAVTSAIQMAWLGTNGIVEVAKKSANGAHYLVELLTEVGISPIYDTPFLFEVALDLPIDPDLVIERMAEEGFLAGITCNKEITRGLEKDVLTVAVTEKRTRQEIESFVNALGKVIQ
ncbi:MAG: glycine dehydrogenase, partial [Acidimicrobiales bacterium]|nr:glycine dehydrogenase [Acidimicrobiales bacterium]